MVGVKNEASRLDSIRSVPKAPFRGAGNTVFLLEVFEPAVPAHGWPPQPPLWIMRGEIPSNGSTRLEARGYTAYIR